jgi:hypothetical protein
MGLDGRRRQRLCLQLDPGSDMQRLYSSDRGYSSADKPREKMPCHARIRAARVRLAGRRREELPKSHPGAIAGSGDQCREHEEASETEIATTTA